MIETCWIIHASNHAWEFIWVSPTQVMRSSCIVWTVTSCDLKLGIQQCYCWQLFSCVSIRTMWSSEWKQTNNNQNENHWEVSKKHKHLKSSSRSTRKIPLSFVTMPISYEMIMLMSQDIRSWRSSLKSLPNNICFVLLNNSFWN